MIVVGGGPAGMMAALTAAEMGHAVTLLEKNEVAGKKLLITGKGRCNVTTACEKERFFEQIPRNAKFLYTAFSGFDNRDTMDFFETLGVPLKIERGERVFPESDRAVDIRDALVGRCRALGVRFMRNRAVRILTEGGAVSALETERGRLHCDVILLSTGGLSYPATGSTGDGYRMASEVGHTIVEPRPSLVPVVTKEIWPSRVMGLTLKNVGLALTEQNKQRPVWKGQGELLFTHFGLSGPLVLSASAHIREGGAYRFDIDCKPALDFQQLDARILRDFSVQPNKTFAHALDKLLPKALIPIVIELSEISPALRIHSVTKEQRRALAETIKGIPLTVEGLRPIEEAIVTAGGVSVKEVDPRTMESKIVKGLYFAGEILDLDALTGGYNLQIAFSTGHQAGTSF